MPILGHGIDLVEVARVQAMLDDHGERFLTRCYTEGERAYCAANPSRMAEHLAGRFAAKEAVLKVLGTGWSGGIAWTDVEVVREASGKPGVRLAGEAAAVAAGLGITTILLSISHTSTHAMASAIGVSDDSQAEP
ncbi:MAG: holo-[acyl-carrier-protein] synthase [Planctomycetes bacterium]|nr:holo-[acyl-carrier-protein] synthase [Planctomycetota bacterium]